jgi:hypothetical protein
MTELRISLVSGKPSSVTKYGDFKMQASCYVTQTDRLARLL